MTGMLITEGYGSENDADRGTHDGFFIPEYVFPVSLPLLIYRSTSRP